MNKEIELSIDTSVSRFKAWLTRYIQSTLPYYVILEEGEVLYIVKNQTSLFESSGSGKLDVMVATFNLNSTEENAKKPSPEFPVVKLEVNEKAENLVQCKLLCVNTHMESYFLDMLKEVIKLWPKTRSTIEDGLISQEQREKVLEIQKKVYEEYGGEWIPAAWDIVKNRIDSHNVSGLGMLPLGRVTSNSPEDPLFGGAAFWEAGNSHITLNSAGPDASVLKLQVQRQSANREAMDTWQRLVVLLKKEFDEQASSMPVKSKRGPRNYSKQVKIDAVRKWDSIDKDENPILLDEFLDKEFGSESGVLKVAPSTFHGWRKLLENP